MIEIQHLLANREDFAEIAPVVRRAIGHFDDPQMGPLDQRPHHLRGQLPLEGGFVGLRHPGHTTGAQTHAVAVIIRHGGTTHLLISRRATG